MSVAQISQSQGRALKSAPGYVLRTDAAIAFDNACMAFGKAVILTGAWRSYETQKRIFLERYEPGAYSPYGDYRRWNGVQYGRVRGAAAAVPGTSNHGGGVAFDAKTRRDPGDRPRNEAVVFTSWGDSDRVGWLEAAKPFGWRETEGRRVGEPWHITYYPALDLHRGKVLGKPGSVPSKPSTPKKRRPHVIATIKRGDETWRTGLLERFLKSTGDYKGKIDNSFGPALEKALKAWQGRAGLVKDGVAGKKTWLRACATVKPGDRGPRVEICQRMLGLSGDDVDGVAGKTYETRSKEVQRWLGVTADAKWGSNSIDALLKKG